MKQKTLPLFFFFLCLFMCRDPVICYSRDDHRLVQLMWSQWINGYYLYSWSPDEKQVAFVMETGGNIDIWTTGRDGDGLRRVTTNRSKDILPSWSPDGEMIAFLSDRGGEWALWVMEREGGNPRKLLPVKNITPLTTEPVWSPDSSMILTISFLSGNWDLWRVDRSGANPLQITHDDRNELAFSWVKGGSHILFASTDQGRAHICMVTREGLEEERLTEGSSVNLLPEASPDGRTIAFVKGQAMSSAIYSMDMSGKNGKALTDDHCLNTLPRWSADSRRIAFISNRSGGMNLWTMGAGGENPLPLTENMESLFGLRWLRSGPLSFVSYRNKLFDFYLCEPGRQCTSPLTQNSSILYGPGWSPDSRYVISTFQEGPRSMLLLSDIQDRASEYVFQNNGESQLCPQWNPVSALVAFSGTEGGSIHIWIGNMDDNTARQITHGEEKSVLPSWSPDGSHLAYYCCRNGSWELWITGQEDGAMRRLCAVQGEEGDEPERPPAWSDDGKRILFCEKQVSGMYLVSVDPDTGQRSYIIKSGELLSNPYIRAERAFFSKSFSDREEIICYDYRQGKSLRLSNSRISGSRLWFCMNDDMLIFTRNNDLWSMNRNGFNKKLLFSMEGEESYPAISPDGSMLAFVSVRGNNRDLYVYTLVTHQ